MNHMAGGIIDDGMQVGFAFLTIHPDLWTMEEIGGPELAKILMGKGPCRRVGFEMRVTVQICGRREAVEGCTGGIYHIPKLLVDQLTEKTGQSPSWMLSA